MTAPKARNGAECLMLMQRRMAASSAKRSLTVCLSVRLSRLFSNINGAHGHGILNVTNHGAACDAASVHLGLTIRRTDVLVLVLSSN